MKEKAEIVLMLSLLSAFLLFSLPQQTLARDVDYVYPTIETSCEQINATAYRFYPGDTLNLTFVVQGPVIIWYAENYTARCEIIYPPGYYTEGAYARFCEFWFIDGKMTGVLNMSTVGTNFSWHKEAINEEGEHTFKIVYLFIGYGDFQGFYEINFLSERYAKLEKLPLRPNSTPLLVISGAFGASIAFAISAVIWHKKRNLKEETKSR